MGQEQEWVVLMGHSRLKEGGAPNGKIGKIEMVPVFLWKIGRKSKTHSTVLICFSMMGQFHVYGLIWVEYCSNHIWLGPNTPTPADCGLSLLLLQILSLTLGLLSS